MAAEAAAIKESVSNPIVRGHLARIGEHLHWHGALSVDYIVDQASGTPYYFDCNPRLVEPMSAVFAGLDLVDLLLRVSRGETIAAGAGQQRAASAPILRCRRCLAARRARKAG